MTPLPRPSLRRRGRTASRTAVATAVIATLLPAVAVSAPAQGVTAGAPVISPTPQSVEVGRGSFPLSPRVGIVAGDDADPAALALVEKILAEAGARPTVTRERDSLDTPVLVHVGGPAETPGAAEALDQLGVEGPARLPAQGYVLAAGIGQDGRKRIVLAGKDATGTFYAAQTLRQVIDQGPGRPRIPALTVRDWPGFGFRGGMESYYGPQWSQADRLAQVDFLAAHKMDTFFYGPAGDPRTGALWDSPYDREELGRMAEVVARAQAQHVNVIYRVSPEAPMQPSAGICHADQADRESLVARFEQLWTIGIRQFTIAWDDVAGGFTCDLDHETYGGDPSPLAAAQADVVNHVQRHFIDTHEGAMPLLTVPTEYWGNSSTTYRSRFDELLTRAADIYWSGPDVVARSISLADVEAAQAAFPNHDLVVWDNYPVNDMSPTRLFMGPVSQRGGDIGDRVLGITFNEMPEQAPSQLVLFTEADYAWNPVAYEPDTSWDRALRELGGEVHSALRTFAENNHSTFLDGRESLTLAPLLAGFRDAYTSFGPVASAAVPLRAELDRMTQAPATLRGGLDDPLFLAQTSPWLDKLGLYGEAGRSAVDLLQDQVHGDLGGAWAARLEFDRRRGELATIPQVVAANVMDPFLDLARAESDGWFGARWQRSVADVTGSPEPAAGSSLGAAADGDVSTAYRAASATDAGDALTLTLAEARPVEDVLVLRGAQNQGRIVVHGRTPAGEWVLLGATSAAAAEVPARGLVLDALRLSWREGEPAPVVHEVVPRFADALTADLTSATTSVLAAAGSDTEAVVTLRGIADQDLRATVSASVPAGWSVTPAAHRVEVRSEGRTVSATQEFTVSVPAGTPTGAYPVTLAASSDDGRRTAPVVLSVQVAPASTEPYAELVGGDAPVGYWRLDEPSGPTAADSSGRGNTGEYRPTVQHGESGALTRPTDMNAAARLTGGYVNVPNSPDLQITGPFTLEAWINPDGQVADPGLGIVERYDGPANNGYILRLVGGNRIQAWVLGATAAVNVTGTVAVAPGAWHHVAAVYDGTTLSVYVDGQQDGSVAATVAPGAGAGDLRLGARGDDANQRFAGALDEVAVYAGALTGDQIAARFLTGRR
jgi:hypothetical protein